MLSLRSRRLEVLGERENGHARGRHARGEGAPSPLACLLLARPFFLVPTTPKRLLRKLKLRKNTDVCMGGKFVPSTIQTSVNFRYFKELYFRRFQQIVPNLNALFPA